MVITTIEAVLSQTEPEVIEISTLSFEQLEFIGGGQATVNTI